MVLALLERKALENNAGKTQTGGNTFTERTPITGADYWCVIAANHGWKRAVSACVRYFEKQSQQPELTENDCGFCDTLFRTAYEATARIFDRKKFVYPFGNQTALKYGGAFADSLCRYDSEDCARLIGKTLNSFSGGDCYNLNLAAYMVILESGFNRLNMVLANHIQQNEGYTAHRQWADGFAVPEGTRIIDHIDTAHDKLNAFVGLARWLYEELGGARFTLPGREESGWNVENYSVTRTFTFNTGKATLSGIIPTTRVKA